MPDNNFSPHQVKFVAATTAVIGVTSLFAYFLQRYLKRRSYWTQPFVKVGVVEKLYVYPIKSCKPISVPWMDCEQRGGCFGENRDRYLLVVDEAHDHMFLTARTYPKMVLIESEAIDNTLKVRFPGIFGEVQVDLESAVARGDVRQGRLFNARTDGYDCGDEIGAALTAFLGVEGKRRLRLLYFAFELHTERDYPSQAGYWHNQVPELTDHIGYADLAAYHAFCTASVEDLNAKLEAKGVEPVSAGHFRPSILIAGDGLPPFDEDKWLSVRIGGDGEASTASAELICYKPCTRCVLTTVDPATGEKREGLQPLRELRAYRLAPKGKLLELFKDSPIFGVNLALTKRGRIAVGDEVWVQYKPSGY